MNKKLIITALLALVAMTGQGQETTGRVMLTDSIAIRADSLCQRNDICNHNTIRKDSSSSIDYLLFAKSKDQHGVLVLML